MSSSRSRSRPARPARDDPDRDDRDDRDDADIRELIAERIPFCDDCGEALVPGEENKHRCGDE